MQQIQKTTLSVIFVACAVSSIHCSTVPQATMQPIQPTSALRTFIVPAGVDSNVAVYADSLARESFVSIDRQEEAAEIAAMGSALVEESDSLWNYLSLEGQSRDSVSAEDENAAIEAYNEGVQAIAPVFRAIQADTSGSEAALNALLQQHAQKLDEAQQAFERAIELNPFDDPTRNLLAQVYYRQARRHGAVQAYQKSVEILERLVRLQPGQHVLYAALANSYLGMKRWTDAARNYASAARVYLDTYDLIPGDTAAVADTLLLYQYAVAEADAHVRNRTAAPALAAYDRALELSTSDSQVDFVKGEIAWVNWDAGNINSSYKRDSLVTLAMDTTRLDAAEAGFNALLSQLATQSARDEIHWRLAMVEYLNDKQEAAAKRLQDLAHRTEMGPDGLPVDSTYARYLDDYGIVTFNLAMQYLGERRDNLIALNYLQQSAEVPWKQRAKAMLEAAKLLRNNMPEAIRYAEMAREHEEGLNRTERIELYHQLLELYRRQGNRDMAQRYLDIYRTLAD